MAIRSQLRVFYATCYAMAATVAPSAMAQNATAAHSRSVGSVERATPEAKLDERLARDWGLTAEEWLRYQTLMSGPLGVYSPNLDPLTALGIESRSEAERRRFADLQVQAEARRTEKLLAYQRAYDAAWQRRYPGVQRVNSDAAGSASVDPGRLAVFVKMDCAQCDQRVRQLQAAGAAFDLYMVGSRQDDARIREWAARVGVEPAKVRARSITLNHDAGRWLSLGMNGDLPAVVRQVNGQWQRQ